MLRCADYFFVFLILLAGTVSAAQAGFDGKWRLMARGDSGCYMNTNAWTMTIAGNRIIGKTLQGYSRNGSITSSGQFRIQGPNTANAGREVVITGNLSGPTGRGTYHVLGGKCAGTVILTKQ